MDIVDEIYRVSDRLPDSEKYALIGQIKRSSISIPSNIAEGWGRESDKSFLNFLKIARGSLYELETQIEIAVRQGFIRNDNLKKLLELLTEESKMLSSFMAKLKGRITSH